MQNAHRRLIAHDSYLQLNNGRLAMIAIVGFVVQEVKQQVNQSPDDHAVSYQHKLLTAHVCHPSQCSVRSWSNSAQSKTHLCAIQALRKIKSILRIR